MSEMVKSAQFSESDDMSTCINERILKECYSLYTDPENGLIPYAENVGLNLNPPRRKVTVMVLGNHSAGKSSFINWYLDDHILKTGVAIETQGFAFVTTGKKREVLTGNASLHLFPHFQPLRNIEGVVENLSTEVSVSQKRLSPLLVLIDTPGLVDGDMTYPFDVNKALPLIADLCDLVLVFFDPIGQALCKRTLNIVDKINEANPEKLRVFLSKADEAGVETDRQRVMMQIVQELCKRSGLNKIGFNMPAIYIPELNKQSRCVNQIEDVCKEVSKCVSQVVQTTLDELGEDCKKIITQTELGLSADTSAKAHNKKAKWKALGFSLLGFLLPVVLIIQLMIASAPVHEIRSIFGDGIAEALIHYMAPSTSFWKSLSNDNQMTALAITLGVSGLCLILSRVIGKTRPTLKDKTRASISHGKEYIKTTVMPQKEKLYNRYLEQSIGLSEAI